MQHRQGTGHVYSSAYTTDDEARKVLMDNLEGNIRVELRLLKFKTGRRTSAWVKNCVAIGLAGGFVEPLESTSIHLIQAGITRLLRLFPISGCSESLRRQYNQESRIEYERIRDFIVLHYKATERDDTPYWRDCRDMSIPDSLAHRLELFHETGMVFPDAADVFRVDSWVQVLVGQRNQGECLSPPGAHVRATRNCAPCWRHDAAPSAMPSRKCRRTSSSSTAIASFRTTGSSRPARSSSTGRFLDGDGVVDHDSLTTGSVPTTSSDNGLESR